MIPIYGINDSNGQSTIAVLLLIFFAFVLPALVMWFDEYMWVDEVEKEQKDHTALGHYL